MFLEEISVRGLLIFLGFWAILSAVFYRMYRRPLVKLRAAPEFAEKTRVIEAYRRFLRLGVLLWWLPLTLASVGFIMDSWASSAMLSGAFGLHGVLFVIVGASRRVAWLTEHDVARAHRYRKPDGSVAWSAWARNEVFGNRPWWNHPIPIVASGLVLIAISAWGMLDQAIPGAQWSYAHDWEERFERQIEGAVGYLSVEAIHVRKHWPERWDRGWDHWDKEHPEANLVHLYLPEDAMQYRAREAAKGTRDLLATESMDGRWLIKSSIEDGPTFELLWEKGRTSEIRVVLEDEGCR
jgi:hypothetical protein